MSPAKNRLKHTAMEKKAFHYQDLGQIAYPEALEIQTTTFDTLLHARIQGIRGENRLFFCEHHPVFTLGKNGQASNLLVSEALLNARGIAFYRTNRGGDITYHGPGQITAYPIFDLETFHMGLRQYVNTLEETVIRFLALYGLKGERLPGATGVWLEPETKQARKICAIGVKSSRFITMHGLALNIRTDLSNYSLIHPCGITDKGVTSLANELPGYSPDFEETKNQLHALFIALFRPEKPHPGE
jgi:lipoyl(octanoyl) transferase